MFGMSKEIINVIEWPDPHPDHIVFRWPENGAGEIKFGSQLTVRESQVAVFYRDGKALDTFGPGRHTLTTANLPIVSNFLKGFTGGANVFSAEVYFISQKVFTDLKWGTPNPIDMKDPDLGWVQLRAFGSFSIRINEPMLFINTLVGQQRLYTTTALNQYLKGSLRTHLNDLIGTTFESYAKIRGGLQDLASAMKVKVRNDFGKYGIELVDFFIQDVSVPEEIQEAFRMRAKMGALGVQNYMQYQTANAMVEMAKNPGGGGQAMQMGAGLGMGMAMPGMMANQMGYPPPGYGYPPPGYPPPQPGYGYPPPGYPPQPQQGYPPQQQGYPPQQQGYPPQQQGYPPQAAPEAVACGKCQSPNQPGARFCYNCGYQFPPPGQAAPPPPGQPG